MARLLPARTKGVNDRRQDLVGDYRSLTDTRLSLDETTLVVALRCRLPHVVQQFPVLFPLKKEPNIAISSLT